MEIFLIVSNILATGAFHFLKIFLYLKMFLVVSHIQIFLINGNLSEITYCSVGFSSPVTRNTKDPSSLLLTWQILLVRPDGSEEREVDEYESLHLVAF